MDATQSFRLVGTTDIVEIPCDQEDGHNVIYWEDIRDVFPGVQYVMDGRILVRKLRDTGPDGSNRQRIRHHPGVVLDVVLSSPVPSDPVISPPGYSKVSPIGHQNNTSETGLHIGFDKNFGASLERDIQAQIVTSMDTLGLVIQAIQEGHVQVDQPQFTVRLQELKELMEKNSLLMSAKDLEVTQSFRLDGHTEILELPCNQDDGHNFIDWDVIQDVFPSVQYVKNGEIVVRKLCDTGPEGNTRQRIRHQPGVVLDVVLSSSVPSDAVISPPGHSKVPPIGHQTSVALGTSTDDHIIEDPAVNTSETGLHIGFDENLGASLTRDIQEQIGTSMDALVLVIQAIQDGRVHGDRLQLTARLQALKELMEKNSLLMPVKDLTATQSFHLVGTDDIVELECDQYNGQNVIYWDDLLDVFPGAQYIKIGSTVVSTPSGTGPDRDKPQYIEHHLDLVLDVVLSDSVLNDSVRSLSGDSTLLPVDLSDLPGTPSDYHVIKGLEVDTSAVEPASEIDEHLDTSPPFDTQAETLDNLDCGTIQDYSVHVDQLHEQVIDCLKKLKVEMVLNSKLTSAAEMLVLARNEFASKKNDLKTKVDELKLKHEKLADKVAGLQEDFDAKQDELQIQAANQLSQLQHRVQALATHSYEPRQNPTPRFFIILPQDTSSWNPLNLFSNKFRLYFLCECGEYTRSTNSKIPHHTHLAKHEGYEIKQPAEFIQQYGSYVLTILRVLKYRVSVAGVTIPAVSHLVRTNDFEPSAESLKLLSGSLAKGIDQAIDYLEVIMEKGGVVHGLSDQVKNNDALEGADLSKLESFLNHKDEDKVLGNLFRTVTAEERVKWVCIDHYRDSYQENAPVMIHNSTVPLVLRKDVGTSTYDDYLVEDPKPVTLYTGKHLPISSHLEESDSKPGFDKLLPHMKAHALSSLNVQSSFFQNFQNSNALDVRYWTQTNDLPPDYKSEINDRIFMSEDNDLSLKDLALVSDVKDPALRSNELVTDFKYLKSRDIENIELSTEIVRMQEETEQLLIQTRNRLALIQHRMGAVMRQTFELHEYPIPRLFVVLPQNASKWDQINIFSNKFRLYFLCECGEHTKPINPRIPHHIHIAKHEGYEISRPTEFFEQYGLYALTIMNVLKFGLSVAGVSIPALSDLVRIDALDMAAKDLKKLSGDLQKGMDQAIGYLEKVTAGHSASSDGIFDQMESNEALEGSDLRKLESFLRKKDGNKALGNLYRTVTSEGHVKWVCIDHYRENYNEKAVKAFRDTVKSMGGSFDENVGSARVHLRSKTQAKRFYQALEKSKSVYELDIALDWETTQSDFKKLRDTLRITNVGALRLDLRHQTGPTSDILNRNRRHDPIFDIMRHPSTRSTAIAGAPEDFIERSSLQSQHDEFSNLRYLGIPIGKDIQGIKALLSKTPNLSELVLDDAKDGIAEVYNAIVEYQTYPITFDCQFWQMRISPPTKESRQLQVPVRSVKELLDGFKDRIEIVESDRSALVGAAAEIFASSKWDGTNLLELKIETDDRLGDTCIKNLAATVSLSELRSLEINLRGEEGEEQIVESIQWKHMRRLEIDMDKGSTGTRAMKALVEGRDKEQGQVELDYFYLYSSETVSSECAALCKSFVASTLIKRLGLGVMMTPSDMESMLNTMDVARLEDITLRVEGYSSSEVDRVLDCLTNAHNLRGVHLPWYTPTQEQIQRMHERGVTLHLYNKEQVGQESLFFLERLVVSLQ